MPTNGTLSVAADLTRDAPYGTAGYKLNFNISASLQS